MFIYLDFLDLTLYLWQLRVTFKTSLAAQWLRLRVSTARGTSLISTCHAAWQKKKKKKGVLLPPDMEGAPFIWEIYFLFQEDRKEG